MCDPRYGTTRVDRSRPGSALRYGALAGWKARVTEAHQDGGTSNASCDPGTMPKRAAAPAFSSSTYSTGVSGE